MNILLNPIGSRGGIQPLIALARALHENGHQVRVAGSPNGAEMAKEYGIEFYPVEFDVHRAAISQIVYANRGKTVLA